MDQMIIAAIILACFAVFFFGMWVLTAAHCGRLIRETRLILMVRQVENKALCESLQRVEYIHGVCPVCDGLEGGLAGHEQNCSTGMALYGR